MFNYSNTIPWHKVPLTDLLYDLRSFPFLFFFKITDANNPYSFECFPLLDQWKPNSASHLADPLHNSRFVSALPLRARWLTSHNAANEAILTHSWSTWAGSKSTPSACRKWKEATFSGFHSLGGEPNLTNKNTLSTRSCHCSCAVFISGQCVGDERGQWTRIATLQCTDENGHSRAFMTRFV